MAITVDLRQSGTSSTGAASLSWSHTLGSDSQIILQVHTASDSAATGVNWDDAGTPIALTREGRANTTDTLCWAEIWFLKAPAARGSKTIKVSYTVSCICCTGSASYNGVDQTTPYNAASPQTAVGTASTASVTATSNVGELVTDCMVDNEVNSDTLVVGSGQTTIFNITVTPGTNIAGAASDELGASSVVMSWTGLTGAAQWATIAVSLRPAITSGLGKRPAIRMKGPQVRRFLAPVGPPPNWRASVTAGAFTGTMDMQVVQPVIALNGTTQDNLTGTIAITVPKPTIALAGSMPVTGTMAIAVPTPTIALNGTVQVSITGTIGMTVPTPTIALSGGVPQTGVGGRPRARADYPRRKAPRVRLEDLPMPVDQFVGRLGFKVPSPRIAMTGWQEPGDARTDDQLLYRLAIEDEDLALALAMGDTWMD